MELLNFNKMKTPHGQPGHLNVLIRDQDSSATDYGKHARVVAYCPKNGVLEGRVDMVWNLPAPTNAQILKAAKKHDQDIKGRWTPDPSTPPEKWKSSLGYESYSFTFKQTKK